MSRPKTKKPDMLRAGYGSLLMQVPSGGCSARKCVRRQDHEGACWPKEKS